MLTANEKPTGHNWLVTMLAVPTVFRWFQNIGLGPFLFGIFQNIAQCTMNMINRWFWGPTSENRKTKVGFDWATVERIVPTFWIAIGQPITRMVRPFCIFSFFNVRPFCIWHPLHEMSKSAISNWKPFHNKIYWNQNQNKFEETKNIKPTLLCIRLTNSAHHLPTYVTRLRIPTNRGYDRSQFAPPTASTSSIPSISEFSRSHPLTHSTSRPHPPLASAGRPNLLKTSSVIFSLPSSHPPTNPGIKLGQPAPLPPLQR